MEMVLHNTFLELVKMQLLDGIIDGRSMTDVKVPFCELSHTYLESGFYLTKGDGTLQKE